MKEFILSLKKETISLLVTLLILGPVVSSLIVMFDSNHGLPTKILITVTILTGILSALYIIKVRSKGKQ